MTRIDQRHDLPFRRVPPVPADGRGHLNAQKLVRIVVRMTPMMRKRLAMLRAAIDDRDVWKPISAVRQVRRKKGGAAATYPIELHKTLPAVTHEYPHPRLAISAHATPPPKGRARPAAAPGKVREETPHDASPTGATDGQKPEWK